MIYTIGVTTSYERYFEEDSNPQKLGKSEDYEGGIVFRTLEDAKSYLNCDGIIIDGRLIPSAEFSIYGVMANWEKDTLNGRLLKDSVLTRVTL